VEYYSVQVKSTNRPVVFSSRESVEWLVGYPAALLLCVVDKKEARIRVFQTTARFGAAVNLELPERLKLLLNAPAGEGRTLDWDEAGNCKLGPPILEFKTDDLLKDDLVRKYREVLVYWVQCDGANVRRYQMGMRSVNLPGKYQTNEVPLAPNARYFLNYPSTAVQAKADETALELEEWLGPLKLQSGDSLGALLVACLTGPPQGRRQRPGWGHGRHGNGRHGNGHCRVGLPVWQRPGHPAGGQGARHREREPALPGQVLDGPRRAVPPFG
jgi:hypothetical protein